MNFFLALTIFNLVIMKLNNINVNNDSIEQNLSLECPICYTNDNLEKKF